MKEVRKFVSYNLGTHQAEEVTIGINGLDINIKTKRSRIVDIKFEGMQISSIVLSERSKREEVTLKCPESHVEGLYGDLIDTYRALKYNEELIETDQQMLTAQDSKG